MKEPKAGDHVKFPDTRPNYRGEYIDTVFDQGGTHLLIRTDANSNAAWYIDDNFKDQFQIDYEGTAPNGKNKWIVKFRKPVPAQKNIWTVRLMVDGRPAGVYETTAPTERKALSNAVVRWCTESHIPSHKYRLYVDLFTEDLVGRYSYTITKAER